MDLTKYRNKLIGSEDERAVSPVIGVILMVAITVILAAVIAAFVLDIGDLDDSAPNANFDYNLDDEGEYIESVEHTSGDSVDANNVEVNVEGDDTETHTGDWGDASEISAGDQVDLTSETDNIDTVTIIWESDGSSSTLAEFEV